MYTTNSVSVNPMLVKYVNSTDFATVLLTLERQFGKLKISTATRAIIITHLSKKPTNCSRAGLQLLLDQLPSRPTTNTHDVITTLLQNKGNISKHPFAGNVHIQDKPEKEEKPIEYIEAKVNKIVGVANNEVQFLKEGVVTASLQKRRLS